MKKVKKAKVKNNIKTFIKSQNMVLIIFLLFIVFLMFYSRSLIKNERMFVVESSDKTAIFKDGVIILNNKTHYFIAPKIDYTGKSVKLKNYTAGYYVGNKKIYELKNNKGKDEFDLESVIENENFSVYEPRKKAVIFNKKTVNKLIKMKFIIVGKTVDGKNYKLEIPLTVSEI